MPLKLDDSSVVIASRGYVFVAPKNEKLPTGGLNDFAKKVAGASPEMGNWQRLANTSRENLPEFSVEAGAPAQKGSWENVAIRTVYGDRSVSFTLNLLQHDAETMSWAFNGWKATDGKSAIMPSTGGELETAITILIWDGTKISGFYIPNNTATANGLPALSTEDFSEVSLSCTIRPADTAAIPAGQDGRTGLLQIFEPTDYTP